MTHTVVHYIHDPLCGWCYAAAPLAAALKAHGLPLKLQGGGLWAPAGALDAGRRQHIRHHDQRIAALSGVPFGEAYLEGLLENPATRFWSRPLTAAVLAAGSLEEGADLAMLHAIQHAHYVEGRAVVEQSVLASVAEGLGHPRELFLDAWAAAPVDAHIQATRQLMATHAVHGFPAFVLERQGAFAVLDHQSFYGQPAAFAQAVLDFNPPEVMP